MNRSNDEDSRVVPSNENFKGHVTPPYRNPIPERQQAPPEKPPQKE